MLTNYSWHDSLFFTPRSWLLNTVLNFLHTAKYMRKLALVLMTMKRSLNLISMKTHSGTSEHIMQSSIFSWSLNHERRENLYLCIRNTVLESDGTNVTSYGFLLLFSSTMRNKPEFPSSILTQIITFSLQIKRPTVDSCKGRVFDIYFCK